MTGHLPVYLDCNATTPVEEEVIEAMTFYLRTEYGNAGSRTHRFGTAAAQAVRRAREQVAAVVDASWEDVVFTSGATESNNLAILGLVAEAEKLGKKHIISTQIEHKAVLEPLEQLSKQGFEVTLLPPDSGGVVDANAVRAALRDDTFLVSVMHVNNETGVIQPLDQIAEVLGTHPAILHTDSAQGFGKELGAIRNARVDLISISAHKIYGPKGIGALIERQSLSASRLRPMAFGGGQERGRRPGTVPVHLAVGLGVASEIAVRDYELRRKACQTFRRELLSTLAPLDPVLHGDPTVTVPHVVNLRFSDIDAEALMLSLKDVVAISSGSACTSTRYEPSHVLKAMGLTDIPANAATRWSWCHMTPRPNWSLIAERVQALK